MSVYLMPMVPGYNFTKYGFSCVEQVQGLWSKNTETTFYDLLLDGMLLVRCDMKDNWNCRLFVNFS